MIKQRSDLPEKFVKLLESKVDSGFELAGISKYESGKFAGHFFRGGETKTLIFRPNWMMG